MEDYFISTESDEYRDGYFDDSGDDGVTGEEEEEDDDDDAGADGDDGRWDDGQFD